MSHSVDSRSRAGVVAALLVAVIAAVHLQQYVDFISEVPTVGVLFVLNAAGRAGFAVALIGRDRPLRLLAAMGSIGLAAGSLISIAIALTGAFLGYGEPTLRLAILIAIVAEVAALPVLVKLITAELRVWRTGPGIRGTAIHLTPPGRRPTTSGRASSAVGRTRSTRPVAP